MIDLAERYRGAMTWGEFLASAREKVELWTGQRKVARVDDAMVARADVLPGRWHLLVLSEDWCGDAVNTVPVLDELAARSAKVELRILARDQHLDLMDLHLTDGTRRSIPVVIVLDQDFVEVGWWGPRPSVMQQWFRTPEAQALDKAERYKRLRTMYARDRGRSIVHEVLSLIEDAAARQPSAVTHGA